MSDLQTTKILATAAEFVGRERELDAVLRHAEKTKKEYGLLLSGAPFGGASELLRQAYDRLFSLNSPIVPFYFALKKSDLSAEQAAIRFLQTFLQQTIAFRRQDAEILNFGGDVCELARLAVPSDGFWIDRLIEICRRENRLHNERTFVRQALSAPLRAAASGIRVFVMIDDAHLAENLSGETNFFEELSDIFARFGAPYVFAGRRRFLFGRAHGGYQNLPLAPLSFADAGRCAEALAENYNVAVNEQTRDLIAVQMQGIPGFIKFLIQAAGEKNVNLDSFRQVEKVYTDEIFGGRISKFYDALIDEIAPDVETQKNITGLLYDSLTIEREKSPIEAWRKRVGVERKDFYRTMNRLNERELIHLTSNHAAAAKENEILSDYLHGRFRLETLSDNRALVIGESLSTNLKRAPRRMARFYRRSSAIGLREIFPLFDRQEISLALLDYSRFRAEYKGAPEAELLKNLQKDDEKIRMPQIVYAAHASDFYAPVEQSIERERAAIAMGFERNRYTDEDEIVWLAAEIDSKLEASKELAEAWCDRLEVAALMCNFLNYKIWLVAPEGFSPDALAVLRRRNAFGSSRRQVELLIKTLDAENILGEKLKANEYEMIVPMGEDTEMIAAQTIEEIARRHNFPARAINQIKTALVEACINAAEHAHSPDRKIYQKIVVENDKIIVTVANRGLRLTDKKPSEVKPDESRRGWGLKLMKTLMDEVHFEETDDGTRISMTKYLQPKTQAAV